jgi:hypothetical protein
MSNNVLAFSQTSIEAIRTCPNRATFSAVVLMVSLTVSSWAQQSTYLNPIEMKGQVLRGSIYVAEHGNDGMIGMNGKGTEGGLNVATVTPGWPAASAGILPGDIIRSIDGVSVKGLDAGEALKPIAKKLDGETLTVELERNGQSKTIAVTVGIRKHLLANDLGWQKETDLPPGVAQPIFGGAAFLTVAMFQTEQHPNHAFLYVELYSKDAPSFMTDDLKFFVLDGTGQQLRHISLDEIRYGIQLAVAQNWRGGNYPPPPPPSQQRQYTISGVQNGKLYANKSGWWDGYGIGHVQQLVYHHAATGLQPTRLLARFGD